MPRPRVTLRVALAVMTIGAVLAWQYSIVLRRREAMESPHAIFLLVPASQSHSPVNVSKLRELLGDRAVQFIYVLPEEADNVDVSRLATVFPEAKISPADPLVQ